MFEDGANSCHRNAGEPFLELLDPRPVFEVLEQRGHRNASTANHPRASELLGTPLDSVALAQSLMTRILASQT